MKKMGDITARLSGIVLVLISAILMVYGGIPCPKTVMLPPVVSVSVLVGGVVLLIGKTNAGEKFGMARLEKHQR